MIQLCGAFHSVPGAAQYRFTAWKTDQGLPQNSVEAITQTRDGYLWIGTRFGLARFDGVRFTTFNVANNPEMVSDTCRALAEDLDGSLWIGTDMGLLRWHQGAFRRYTTEDGLCHDSIRTLDRSKAGGVWIGTSRDYCRFLNGAFTNYDHLHGATEERTAVFEDRQGAVWFNTLRGVVRMDPARGDWKIMAAVTEPPGIRILDFHEAKDGTLWFGNHRGLHCWQGDQFRSFIYAEAKSLAEPMPNSASVVFQSQLGDFWVALGPRRILHRFADGEFTPFHGPNGKPVEQVNCAFEDREGNLWIGTRYEGVLRLRPRRMDVLTIEDGLANDHFWCVCQTRDGSIWAGAADGHFSQIKDKQIRCYKVPDSYSPIKAICEDQAGNLWLGKDSSGTNADSLYLFKAGSLINYNAQAGITSIAVRAIYEDRAGVLWFGTANGMHCLRDGRFTRYTTEQGLSANDVRSFFEDSSGVLWIGTQDGGLNSFRDGKLGPVTFKNKSSKDSIWNIYQDADGALWIGTGSGLHRYRRGQLFTFTRKQGLFDDLVNHLLEDDRGNFWISCNRGIYRVSRRELDDVAEGRTNRVHHVAYGESDGMENTETNGENQPAGWKGRDGRLWFPTIKGLVAINPDTFQDNGLPPPVVIEQVVADEEIIYGERAFSESKASVPKANGSEIQTRNGKIHLPAGRARVLRIQYTANSLVDPSKVLFQYCLDGHDSHWHEAGTRRMAFYTNLRPGDYLFRVKACNDHGRWSEQDVAFAFSLAPHFYETWSFYALCLTAAILLGYGMHRRRLEVQARIQRLEQQHAIELERTRIAKDIHDDIGSCITHISLMSELANRQADRPAEIKAHLRNIHRSTSELFRALDEIIWANNPREDTLESLVTFICKFGQDFLRAADIRCRLDIPDTLPPAPLRAEVRHNLFLAVKEAIHNAVRHSAATEVWIRVRIEAPVLEICIEDNGTGLGSASGSFAQGSDGLLNMKQRLEAIGGGFNLKSDPSLGTKLTMIVRVEPAS